MIGRPASARLAVFALLLLVLAPLSAQGPRGDGWVATWATAVVGRPAAPELPAIANRTLRQIVRTTIGGTRVRVVLSNAFGTAPLAVGAAHLGVRDADAAMTGGRPLTFSGTPAFTIPAGASILSDPVEMAVAPLTDLAVDLFLPAEAGAVVTMHNGANQTNYISTPGNHAGAPALPVEAKTTSWFLLARVEVSGGAPAPVVVTFGDSITDGSRSTPDTNNRWPDHLARRLVARRDRPAAVLNAGIAGNRLLSQGAPQTGVNALARFDRDVLVPPGVTHVVLMEGINDIRTAPPTAPLSAADLVAAQRQLIARARARGLRVYGATLTPFAGDAAWTPEREATRQAVNQWIRSGGMYDGVIDFDAVIRDPAAPAKLLPLYDSGDHLHPNDAGYQAMGEAVDLALFAPRAGS